MLKPPTQEKESRLGNSRGSKSGLDKEGRSLSSGKPVKLVRSSTSDKQDAVVSYKEISKHQASRLKAIQELEKIRIQKAEKEEQKRKEEEKMKELAEKKKANLRKLIQKRRYELNVVRESSEVPLAILYKG